MLAVIAFVVVRRSQDLAAGQTFYVESAATVALADVMNVGKPLWLKPDQYRDRDGLETELGVTVPED